MNLRKRKVLQAALQLFTEKGFQQTSIQDIIQHAEISKGTFYNYFSSKNECFLAILENSRYEASLRRHELIDGQDKSDRDILAKQVAVLMHINQEQNLVPLFEGVFQSSDPQLKEYLTEHRLYEVRWMMTRLIDLYGEKAHPYAYEAAIVFFAVMQHLAITYRATYHNPLSPDELAAAGMRHVDAVMRAMMEHQQIVIHSDSLYSLNAQMKSPSISTGSLIERLKGFIAHLEDDYTNGIQLAEALIEEIEKTPIRYAVLEVLIKPYREAFNGTSHEIASREIAHLIWSYITEQKKNASLH